MERIKMMARMFRAKMVVLTALAIGSLGLSPAFAATTTVGGSLKNTAGVVSVIPGQYNTPTCFSVKLTTMNPTQILAANANRSYFWIVNASTQDMTSGFRPPIVFITTGTTTNLGASPAASLLATMNASPLYPVEPGVQNNAKSGPSRLEFYGDTTWSAAIYGQSESSGTVTYDPLPYVQGCYLQP